MGDFHHNYCLSVLAANSNFEHIGDASYELNSLYVDDLTSGAFIRSSRTTHQPKHEH